MRWVTGRALAILVTAMITTMAAGAAVAQANDLSVVRAVVAASKVVSTRQVKTATNKVDSSLKARHISGVVKPIGVYIRAYRRATKLFIRVHGSSRTGKKLKVDALTSFKDYLDSAIALRASAGAYLAKHITLSNQLYNTYVADKRAGHTAQDAALKQERRLHL